MGWKKKSFGILITYKRLMQHEVMKPSYGLEEGAGKDSG
jgi:hypothetical protein